MPREHKGQPTRTRTRNSPKVGAPFHTPPGTRILSSCRCGPICQGRQISPVRICLTPPSLHAQQDGTSKAPHFFCKYASPNFFHLFEGTSLLTLCVFPALSRPPEALSSRFLLLPFSFVYRGSDALIGKFFGIHSRFGSSHIFVCSPSIRHRTGPRAVAHDSC